MPKISLLTVTHNRPDFWPWLAYNVNRLEWPGELEWVVVGSGPEDGGLMAEVEGVTRYIDAPGANIPEKRNLAMAEATGDFVAWIDDDDWQHPQRLTILHDLLTEAGAAGSTFVWFVDVARQRHQVRRFRLKRPLFNSLLVRSDVATAVPFDTGVAQGSDIEWTKRVLAAGSAVYRPPLTFLLCHNANIGNRRTRRQFNRPLDDIRQMIGREAWGRTGMELTALRKRLGL